MKDYLVQLPPMYYKEYTPGTIFEFDYFEELRQFDTQYLSHTHSGIIRNIKLVFRCDEEDIVDFRNVSEGMTNTTLFLRSTGWTTSTATRGRHRQHHQPPQREDFPS